jgi:GTPase SAR1 family protein
MKFDNRLWKMDMNNLWWNSNRISVRDSLIKHFNKGGHRALLNGCKGCGKSTLAKFLSEKWNVDVYRVTDQDSGMDFEFTDRIVIIDEAQQITFEDRQTIFHRYPRVLMVSVDDRLIDDGYELIQKVARISQEELGSYINHQGSFDLFEPGALVELFKATKGTLRLVNLICKEAIDRYTGFITAKQIETVAKKRFKLRY